MSDAPSIRIPTLGAKASKYDIRRSGSGASISSCASSSAITPLTSQRSPQAYMACPATSSVSSPHGSRLKKALSVMDDDLASHRVIRSEYAESRDTSLWDVPLELVSKLQVVVDGLLAQLDDHDREIKTVQAESSACTTKTKEVLAFCKDLALKQLERENLLADRVSNAEEKVKCFVHDSTNRISAMENLAVKNGHTDGLSERPPASPQRARIDRRLTFEVEESQSASRTCTAPPPVVDIHAQEIASLHEFAATCKTRFSQLKTTHEKYDANFTKIDSDLETHVRWRQEVYNYMNHIRTIVDKTISGHERQGMIAIEKALEQGNAHQNEALDEVHKRLCELEGDKSRNVAQRLDQIANVQENHDSAIQDILAWRSTIGENHEIQKNAAQMKELEIKNARLEQSIVTLENDQRLAQIENPNRQSARFEALERDQLRSAALIEDALRRFEQEQLGPNAKSLRSVEARLTKLEADIPPTHVLQRLDRLAALEGRSNEHDATESLSQRVGALESKLRKSRDERIDSFEHRLSLMENRRANADSQRVPSLDALRVTKRLETRISALEQNLDPSRDIMERPQPTRSSESTLPQFEERLAAVENGRVAAHLATVEVGDRLNTMELMLRQQKESLSEVDELLSRMNSTILRSDEQIQSIARECRDRAKQLREQVNILRVKLDMQQRPDPTPAINTALEAQLQALQQAQMRMREEMTKNSPQLEALQTQVSTINTKINSVCPQGLKMTPRLQKHNAAIVMELTNFDQNVHDRVEAIRKELKDTCVIFQHGLAEMEETKEDVAGLRATLDRMSELSATPRNGGKR